MTRIIVCGGRDYADQDAVDSALDRVHAKRPVTMLVHGAARGADSLADDWAKRRGVPREPHPYPSHLGRAGGPARNAEMAAAGADGCVAFPGGRGTDDMVWRAEYDSIPVWRPYG